VYAPDVLIIPPVMIIGLYSDGALSDPAPYEYITGADEVDVLIQSSPSTITVGDALPTVILLFNSFIDAVEAVTIAEVKSIFAILLAVVIKILLVSLVLDIL
jgi:predicted acylesterase/phospholipase RssA